MTTLHLSDSKNWIKFVEAIWLYLMKQLSLKQDENLKYRKKTFLNPHQKEESDSYNDNTILKQKHIRILPYK